MRSDTTWHTAVVTIYLDDDVMIVGSMGNFVTYDLASRTKTCCTVHTKIDAHKKKTTKKQQKNRKRKVGMQKKKKKQKTHISVGFRFCFYFGNFTCRRKS